MIQIKKLRIMATTNNSNKKNNTNKNNNYKCVGGIRFTPGVVLKIK